MRFSARRAGPALVMAAALLLAGCSTSSDGGPPASASAEQVHSSEELQSVLERFGAGREGARVLGDGQLRDSIPSAEAWLKNLEVNPRECGVGVTGSLGSQLEHAAMSALQLPDSFITLASYQDAGQVAQNFADQEQLSERCARYTVLQDGRHVAFHMARQPVQTNAQKTAANVVTSSDGSSANQQVMIQAADGNIIITINQPLEREDSAGQLARMADEINQLLGLLN